MSDGPYKSLPMRKPWKEAAERAHKPAFSPKEVADAVADAIVRDIRRDIGGNFIEHLQDALSISDQGSLFADSRVSELEAIRGSSTTNGLREGLVEHTLVAVHQGMSSEQALNDGLRRVAIEHGAAGARQVEEHYLRDATTKKEYSKSAEVRARLNESLKSDRLTHVASEVLGGVPNSRAASGLAKQASIDDGPSL